MVLNGLIVPTQAPWYPAFGAELLSFADLLGNQAVVRLRLIAQAACDRNDTLPRRMRCATWQRGAANLSIAATISSPAT
jgi:hypothetical protein